MAYKRDGLTYGIGYLDTGTVVGAAGGDTYGTLYCSQVKFGEARNVEFENSFKYEWIELESIKDLNKKIN